MNANSSHHDRAARRQRLTHSGGARFDGRDRIDSPRLQRRREAEDNARRYRDRGQKAEHRGIDGRWDGGEHGQAGDREPQSQGAPDSRQQQAFR